MPVEYTTQLEDGVPVTREVGADGKPPATDVPSVQFIHEARNALVPSRVHLDALLRHDDERAPLSDAIVRLRLSAALRGVTRVLEMVEDMAREQDGK